MAPSNTVPDAVLIAGPTASGKSALALDIAEAVGGVVINADSMQVYRDLNIITACPDDADRARAPHQLYGYLDGDTVCSAARWGADAYAAMEAAWAAGQLPILVGGTGLYFRALLEGFAEMPEIPAEVRERVREGLAEEGPHVLHARLEVVDPTTATRLNPNDGQRIARALEIYEATGRPISSFQTAMHPGPLMAAFKAGRVLTYVLEWPRELLYARCDARFDAMLEAGALQEVTDLMARCLPTDRPVMKALGVPELIAYAEGRYSLEEARAEAQMQTRRFAKRQMTWFRNQTPAWTRIDAQYMNNKKSEIIQKCR